MPKRVPIAAVERLAREQGLRQAILVGWDGERTHVVTWGSTKAECAQAAEGGRWVMDAITGVNADDPVIPGSSGIKEGQEGSMTPIISMISDHGDQEGIVSAVTSDDPWPLGSTE